MATLKPAERQQFVLDWMKRTGEQVVDVLNADFVDAYIRATGVAYEPMPYGAHKCPSLGRDLGALFRAGLLTRARIGVGCGDGFPAWVYAYERP